MTDKRHDTRHRKHGTGSDTADREHRRFGLRGINTQGQATNPHVTGTDTADRGRSRFAFHSAITTREPSTNSHVMATDITCTACGHGKLGFCGAIDRREPTPSPLVTRVGTASCSSVELFIRWGSGVGDVSACLAHE